MSDSELLRRQTPTERNHELLKLALERPAPVSGNPSFKVSQEKAVGGATVFTWDVHVPVCEEFPTADEALNAAISYGEQLRRIYPPPGGDESLKQQLARSVDAALNDEPPPKPRRVK